MPVSKRDQIQPGDQFAREYKGKLYTCEAVVIGNGLGFRTWDGAEFRTLSTAGKHVVKRKDYEINGYVFWNRAEDMPTRRGPKLGTHRGVRPVEPVAALEGVQSVVPVEPVGAAGKQSAKRSKRVLPIVAAQQQAAKAEPATPKMIKNIKLSADQVGLKRGEHRFFCLACKTPFTARESQPAQCPHGHPAKLRADLIAAAAKEMLA